MICLTGDLHHNTLGTGNQKFATKTENEIAVDYLKLLEDRDVKVTFFITGKSFEQEWDVIKPICESDLVEVAGHTYNCFMPELWHRIWNKLLNSYNGPKWYQKRDVQKTIDIIKEKTGKDILCWRNHMYMHGKYTEQVLSQCGIKICSDGVVKNSNGLISHEKGIYNFPINIIPDHEHLYHAERTVDWVDWWVKRYNWSDDFGSKSYYVDEWADIVIDGLKENENNGIISNMIIHPITMQLCDDFKAFKKILDYIATRETCFMRDLLKEKRENNV